MRLVIFLFGMVCLFAVITTANAQTATSFGVKAEQVNGTWRGQSGEFRVWTIGKQKLRIEFSGIYEYQTPGGPIANLGEARGVAIIHGNRVVFHPNGTSDRCTITMTFQRARLRGRARLRVQEVGECGFGKHVTAAGAYRKASARKPKLGRKIPWLSD